MKLNQIDVGDKQRLKNGKAKGRRFYSPADMSIIKHDIAVKNAQNKKQPPTDVVKEYIVPCGCGATGCFIHSHVKK